MENKFGHEVVKVNRAAGSMSVASASVTFPRSFFVKSFKRLKGVEAEPNEALLAPFIQIELDRLRKNIRACLNLPVEETALAVDTYVDFLPVSVEAPMQTNGGVAMIVGAHGKEIVLGILALASLFMVSTLVRKSAPAAGNVAGMVNQSSVIGSTVDAILGKAAAHKPRISDETAEVGEGGQALDGVELDDETVRAQQVIQQVSTLVKEDPDMAATMIKRWMSK